jgi:hypothetical protein
MPYSPTFVVPRTLLKLRISVEDEDHWLTLHVSLFNLYKSISFYRFYYFIFLLS